MDDITHNCAHCHEVARDPDNHHCGLNPDGGLPASQPHKLPSRIRLESRHLAAAWAEDSAHAA